MIFFQNTRKKSIFCNFEFFIVETESHVWASILSKQKFYWDKIQLKHVVWLSGYRIKWLLCKIPHQKISKITHFEKVFSWSGWRLLYDVVDYLRPSWYWLKYGHINTVLHTVYELIQSSPLSHSYRRRWREELITRTLAHGTPLNMVPQCAYLLELKKSRGSLCLYCWCA